MAAVTFAFSVSRKGLFDKRFNGDWHSSGDDIGTLNSGFDFLPDVWRDPVKQKDAGNMPQWLSVDHASMAAGRRA